MLVLDAAAAAAAVDIDSAVYSWVGAHVYVRLHHCQYRRRQQQSAVVFVVVVVVVVVVHLQSTRRRRVGAAVAHACPASWLRIPCTSSLTSAVPARTEVAREVVGTQCTSLALLISTALVPGLLMWWRHKFGFCLEHELLVFFHARFAVVEGCPYQIAFRSGL